MARNIELTKEYVFIAFVNYKYYIDVRIDFRFVGVNGLTCSCAFLKHLDDSNEYGECVSQQLTLRCSQFNNEEKRFVKDMIRKYYDSLDHSKIILKHLQDNTKYFERRIENEAKPVTKEELASFLENPEDIFN